MRTEKMCIETSREMYSVLARCTKPEAATIVRTVAELAGVEAC